MSDIIKIVFFLVAGVFLVSALDEVTTTSGLRDVGYDSEAGEAYLRSYDRNRDGVVSDEEHRRGELARIEDEIETLSALVAEAIESKNASPYAGMVTLSRGDTWTTDRNEEYVTLEADSDNSGPVTITGWTLKSLISGRKATIGRGVPVLDLDRPWRNTKPIQLSPGDEAIVVSGDMVGINTSFLTNICTGYLGETRDFEPRLPRDCPDIEDVNLADEGITPGAFDEEEDYDMCIDAIEDVYTCERSFPTSDVPKSCRTFIKEFTTYDGCVERFENEPDFLGDEWRIYLSSSKELWREEREAIVLLDENGKVVALEEY